LWRLERATLLSAVEAGRSIQEIREFLSARCEGSMPDTVSGLLDDTAERCMRVWEGGQARLYECRDEVLAALIANDSRTRKHCLRAGDTHLAVPASADAAFRKGLRALGYLVAAAAPAARRKPHTEPGEPAIVAAPAAAEVPVET
jgi:DNA-binding transcriptional MerR regulator